MSFDIAEGMVPSTKYFKSHWQLLTSRIMTFTVMFHIENSVDLVPTIILQFNAKHFVDKIQRPWVYLSTATWI